METALSDTTALTGAISTDYVEWCTDAADEIEKNAESRDQYDSGRLYYPVCIGEVLGQRYRIVHKLGFGGFSTVWMAYDMIEGKDVALKILALGGDKEYFAQDEIIRRVRDRSNLVTYHATFQLSGLNNDLHRALVLPLMGPNLEMTRLEMPKSTHMCSRMSAARQLLVALKGLHDAGIVHQDLNQEAIMWEMKSLDQYDATTKYEYLGRPEKLKLGELWKPGDLVRPMAVPQWLLGDRVYLGNFGMAIAAGTPIDFKVQTPAMFCAPERYHNVDPSFASDMWSYMCIFAMLYLGFEPFYVPEGDDIMSIWANTLGPLPKHWKGDYRYFDDETDDKWYDQNRKPCDHQSLASKVARSNPAANQWEQDLVLSVFAKVFCYEPADRITAAELLEDPQFNTLVEIYNPRSSS